MQRRLNLVTTKSKYDSAISEIFSLNIPRSSNHRSQVSPNTRKNGPLVALTQKISQFSRTGEIDSAKKLFDQMGVRDSVSWNVMMRCYLENGMLQEARELFDKMPERSSFSWNTIIMGYIKAERTYIAFKLFIVMPHRDVVAWTAMITGFCRASCLGDAWCLFKEMPEANAVSWSSIISGFQQNGFSYESLNVFREMLLAGILPTSHVFTSVSSACADVGMVSLSEQLYCQLLRRGFHRNNSVINSAIDMFFKTGSFHNGRHIFLEFNKPDLVAWNTMITGFAQHGYGLEATMLFHQMQKAQVLPNNISYMGVLYACSHCGFVDEGEKYFRSMQMDQGISPRIEHYAVMVDLYARAGKLKRAYDYILEVPVEPKTVLWRALLNGCSIWGDSELGVYAAQNIMKFEPLNSSTCLMVISCFVLAGKWGEVAKMRRIMKALKTGKELGCSWIDIMGRNHLFTTEDRVHPETDKIFSIIELLAYDISILSRMDELSDCSNGSVK